MTPRWRVAHTHYEMTGSVSVKAGSESVRYRFHIIIRQLGVEWQSQIMGGNFLRYRQSRPAVRTNPLNTRK